MSYLADDALRAGWLAERRERAVAGSLPPGCVGRRAPCHASHIGSFRGFPSGSLFTLWRGECFNVNSLGLEIRKTKPSVNRISRMSPSTLFLVAVTKAVQPRRSWMEVSAPVA